MSKNVNKVTELANSQNAVENCRQDFPALAQSINEHPLVYLDSAASAQQPQSVIDKVVSYQSHDHANVHRGVHTLSVRATEAYEGARDIIQTFINAKAAAKSSTPGAPRSRSTSSPRVIAGRGSRRATRCW